MGNTERYAGIRQFTIKKTWATAHGMKNTLKRVAG